MAELVIRLVNGELAGKTMQGLKKEIRETQLAADKAAVGTQAWVDAHQKLEGAKKLQGDLKKQIEGTTSASDMLKTAWNKLPGAQFFNQIVQSFGLMKQGVGGLITQMGVLKTAIASTGIGLLVLALGALVTWFTKTEEGADKLKEVLYPLQALFKMITGLVAELGGKIFKRLAEAVENPVQALKDLGNVIVENVINRFKALAVIGGAIVKLFKGEWKQGLKELADGHIQLATGVTNATDKMNTAFQETKKVWDAAWIAGQKLLKLENDIEDVEARLTVSRAKLNVQASEAMAIARDTSKTDQERLAAAQEFQRITDQQTADEMNFLKLKHQRLVLEQDLDKILTDDERQKRAESEAAIIQLQADNIDKKKKARALELNIVEEIAKREVEIAKNIAQLKAQAAQDGFDQEVAMVQQQTEEKILALQGSEAQILEQKMLLKEIEAQQLIAIGDKYQAIENENFKKAKEDQDKIAKKALSDREKIAAAEAQIEQTKFEAIQETTAGLGELIAGQIKNEKQAKAARKTFALADIGMHLQQEMSANAAAGAKIGAAGAPATVPAGLAYTAAQNLRAFFRAGLATAKVLLFKRGGYVEGPSHQDGGMPGVIRSTGQPLEFEGGEFFFSRRAVQAIGVGTLSRINDRFTKHLATGGPVNPFPDRGPVSRDGLPLDIDYEKMARMMDMVVSKKLMTIKVQNVVTETRDAIKTVNDIQADADF
jgi:hypothetical protein